MFNFFKRSAVSGAKPASKPASKPGKPPASAPPQLLAEPVPIPEVVEGNEHTDWALWEDSVAVLDSQMQSLDSQMQSLTPSARIYQKDKETPSQYQDIDAFDRIHKNDP